MVFLAYIDSCTEIINVYIQLNANSLQPTLLPDFVE